MATDFSDFQKGLLHKFQFDFEASRNNKRCEEAVFTD